MDFQEGQKEQSSKGLAIASMILGIVSICCCCISLPLGGLGIVLAILSKRENREMLGQAKAGLITSIIGIIISIIATVLLMIGSFATAAEDGGETFWKEYEQQYEQQYHQEVPEGAYDVYKDIIDQFAPQNEL
ncbi:MAG: DUF4190 domain-containing protein [bacterium]|nr:DUF4190 domain-containing protein [bacterium]